VILLSPSIKGPQKCCNIRGDRFSHYVHDPFFVTPCTNTQLLWHNTITQINK